MKRSSGSSSRGSEVKTEEQPPVVALPLPAEASGPEEVRQEFAFRDEQIAAPEPPKPAATQHSVVAEVLALKKQLDERRQAAIDQLLEEQRLITDQLAELGFEAEPQRFAVRPIRTSAPRSASASSTPRTPGTLTCKYCGTTGSHDARAHRGQAVKRAFTESELAALKS